MTEILWAFPLKNKQKRKNIQIQAWITQVNMLRRPNSTVFLRVTTPGHNHSSDIIVVKSDIYKSANLLVRKWHFK